MYSNIAARVKTANGLTNEFPIEIGTRQGCNLSPTLFNLFINDLPEELDLKNIDHIKIGSKKANCLMYADDIVLISKSQTAMKTYLEILEKITL